MKVNVTGIKVDMRPVNDVLARLGVTPDGYVQAQVTKIVAHRMTRYMPQRSGVLANDLKKIKSPTEILVEGPYAHFQYNGLVWIYPPTGSTYAPKYGMKEETSRPLSYDHNKNPEAGPHWDRRLMVAEGEAIAADVQDTVDKRRHS